MFSKRKEIDDIELGANLYLKGLKESRQALTTQNTIKETSQEPITSFKNHSEEIFERTKEEPKESRQALVKQNIKVETPQEPKALLKYPNEDILERAKDLLAI